MLLCLLWLSGRHFLLYSNVRHWVLFAEKIKITYLEAAAALRIISRKFKALEATDSIWWSKEEAKGAELWLLELLEKTS